MDVDVGNSVGELGDVVEKHHPMLLETVEPRYLPDQALFRPTRRGQAVDYVEDALPRNFGWVRWHRRFLHAKPANGEYESCGPCR